MLLLITGSIHGRSIFIPVSSCTDISLAQVPIEVYQNCSGKNRVLHCLPNDNDDLGLCCFSITWIEKGQCPYYNNYQGNMDEKPCPGDSNCPDKLFKSPLSIHYKGCYKKEQATTPTATAATTSELKTTTAKREKNITMILPTCNCSRTTSDESSQSSSEPTVTVLAVFVVILLITSAVFVFLYIYLVLMKKDMCCSFSDKIPTSNGAVHEQEGMKMLKSTQPQSNCSDH